MTFSPVVPIGGIAGWRFLNRTLADQRQAFDQNTLVEREISKFKEDIDSIKTAADFVANYDVLKVALGAFGLDNDINSKFFIKKILEDGTNDPKALANKMSDGRYKELSDAFGFGELQAPGRLRTGFSEKIAELYRERQFETKLGEQNNDMRLALNLRREIAKIASADRSSDSMWFGVMGQAPLRSVFETAFGLPSSFGALDLDQQLETFKKRSEVLFGSDQVSQFKDDTNIESLLEQFFARSSLNENSTSSIRGSVALSILQNSTFRYS